jgi:RNA polymerase sigma-70 factor (ECF subfamily)
MTSTAYGEAYRAGFDRTVRFLMSRGAASDGAVEAAQAAWVRGWERLYQLRDEKMVLTWVNTIALNVYRGLLRKEKPVVPLRERHRQFEIDLAPIDVGIILTSCRRRERALLDLQLQGIKADEIADQRGVSKTAIRIRLMRARRSVRDRMERRRVQRLARAVPLTEGGTVVTMPRAPQTGLRVA